VAARDRWNAQQQAYYTNAPECWQYRRVLEEVQLASSVGKREFLPPGISTSDVMGILKAKRSSARLILRRMSDCGLIVASGHSHATRYFTQPPELHGSDGIQVALLEMGKQAEWDGFTRQAFLELFPFPSSTVYKVVRSLTSGRRSELVRRGRTNSMRYYLRDFTPPIVRKQKETA